MSYVTQAQIEDRVGAAELVRLTNDSGGSSVDTDNLARAIEEGEADILPYLGQRYTMPLTLTNAVTLNAVTTKVLDCIHWRLCNRRPPVNQDVVENRTLALKWARDVAEGTIGLPGESLLSESFSSAGKILTETTERVMSRENMSGL